LAFFIMEASTGETFVRDFGAFPADADSDWGGTSGAAGWDRNRERAGEPAGARAGIRSPRSMTGGPPPDGGIAAIHAAGEAPNSVPRSGSWDECDGEGRLRRLN